MINNCLQFQSIRINIIKQIKMGNILGKNFQNYLMPFLPESNYNPKQYKIQKAYSTHLINNQFYIPTYNLNTKTQLKPEELSKKVHEKPEFITLLTYNVWFQQPNIENRYDCILRMLHQSNADFICLQEVTSGFLNKLHSSSKNFNKEGFQYYFPVMKMNWYDTVILSKYPCKFYKMPFPQSSMSRCNLVAVIELLGKDGIHTLAVSCEHLESMNNQQARIYQLEMVQKMVQNADTSIIAGDFNFSDHWKEDKVIQGQDLWKVGKRIFSKNTVQNEKQKGYTMLQTTRFPQWRPDHIIVKGKDQKGKAEISIIGDFSLQPYHQERIEMIAKDDVVRTPSDHLGLFAKIYI